MGQGGRSGRSARGTGRQVIAASLWRTRRDNSGRDPLTTGVKRPPTLAMVHGDLRSSTSKRARGRAVGWCRAADLPKWCPTFGDLLFSEWPTFGGQQNFLSPFLPTPTQSAQLP